MITRTYDLDLINSYLMQPDILPEFFIADERHIYNLNLYFLLGRWGLFPCLRIGNSMECHAAIPYKHRGKKALEDARGVIKWVFEKTMCNRVYSKARKIEKARQRFNAMLLTRCGADETHVFYEVIK